MARRRYVYDKETKAFVEVSCDNSYGTSRGSSNIIVDSMEPLKNPADGKVYTSKSQYDRAVKAGGYEFATKNDLEKRREPEFNEKRLDDAVDRAMYQVGYKD